MKKGKRTGQQEKFIFSSEEDKSSYDEQVKDISQLILELDKDESFKKIEIIHERLKTQFQTNKGVIRRVKDLNDENRKKELDDLVNKFGEDTDLSNLDERLNQLCNTMKEINHSYQLDLSYDFINIMGKLPDLNKLYPECHLVLETIKKSKNPKIQFRLIALVGSIVSQSLSQGNKTNAGVAGASMVHALLMAAGLKKDKDYRTEFVSSGGGSDTDFVLPYVEDREDQDVDIYIAVQFSSNDRARMPRSELGKGASNYLITGNGMDSSTKSLEDIGIDIIKSYRDDKIKIVCHEKELINEKSRLKGLLDSGKGKKENEDKLDYMERFTITLSDFAEKMRQRL